MRVMAVVTVLVGALEVINTIGEIVFGVGSRNIGWYLLVAPVGLAAVGLLAAGIALVRSPGEARRFAGAAAAFALLVFGGLAAFHPFLAIGPSVLGIALPVALLAFLYRGSVRDASRGAP